MTIDAFAFHEWRSTAALTPYMTEAWCAILERPGDLGGPVNLKPQPIHRHPDDDADVVRADFEHFRTEFLDRSPCDRVVLGYGEGLLSTALANHHLVRTVVQAANDWTIDSWLNSDDRLFGLVLIPTGVPEDAGREIRRVGQHDRMVGVAMGTNAFGRPFGHPVYRPIFEAAAELNLPIILQTGSEVLIEQLTPPVGGGLPSTFSEFDALSSQPLVSHVVSMIAEGIFETYPRLKVMVVGGGAGWIPGLLWLFDYWYKIVRLEMPWLRRLPSEYFVEHVRVATADLEAPRESTKLAQLLSTVPGIDSVLVYASGYPRQGWETPDEIAGRLPEAWHGPAFLGNALDLYRWPSSSGRVTSEPRSSVEVIP
jgi:uncharacterized protein